MARIVKEHEYRKKRNEILNTARQLVYTKGYANMTIQDILNELKISSGAFFHYFSSKPAVLEAFIEMIKDEAEKALLPIVHDPHLTALEKLKGFFSTFDNLRTEHKKEVLAVSRVWYSDSNAVVRQKVDEAVIRQRASLLTEIIRQGNTEGIFSAAYPEYAGEAIMYLQKGMGDTHIRQLLSHEEDQKRIEGIITAHDAYMSATEHILGAPPNSLYRVGSEAVREWLEAVRESSDK